MLGSNDDLLTSMDFSSFPLGPAQTHKKAAAQESTAIISAHDRCHVPCVRVPDKEFAVIRFVSRPIDGSRPCHVWTASVRRSAQKNTNDINCGSSLYKKKYRVWRSHIECRLATWSGRVRRRRLWPMLLVMRTKKIRGAVLTLRCRIRA